MYNKPTRCNSGSPNLAME